jgi:hypothetical protein
MTAYTCLLSSTAKIFFAFIAAIKAKTRVAQTMAFIAAF